MSYSLLSKGVAKLKITKKSPSILFENGLARFVAFDLSQIKKSMDRKPLKFFLRFESRFKAFTNKYFSPVILVLDSSHKIIDTIVPETEYVPLGLRRPHMTSLTKFTNPLASYLIIHGNLLDFEIDKVRVETLDMGYTGVIPYLLKIDTVETELKLSVFGKAVLKVY
ncbi:MAG: hypothetical protein AAF353_11985 [Pseudomonadota bacterium]